MLGCDYYKKFVTSWWDFWNFITKYQTCVALHKSVFNEPMIPFPGPHNHSDSFAVPIQGNYFDKTIFSLAEIMCPSQTEKLRGRERDQLSSRFFDALESSKIYCQISSVMRILTRIVVGQVSTCEFLVLHHHLWHCRWFYQKIKFQNTTNLGIKNALKYVSLFSSKNSSFDIHHEYQPQQYRNLFDSPFHSFVSVYNPIIGHDEFEELKAPESLCQNGPCLSVSTSILSKTAIFSFCNFLKPPEYLLYVRSKWWWRGTTSHSKLRKLENAFFSNRHFIISAIADKNCRMV